jgi:hypothetical protein
MKIEIRPLSEIRPYEKNARKIPQRAIDTVVARLRSVRIVSLTIRD